MSMYVSTRDTAEQAYPYSHAAVEGLDRDTGGLFVPRLTPVFSEATLQSFVDQPTVTIFTETKSLFAGDSIPTDVIHRIAEESYSKANFPYAENGIITPLDELQPGIYKLRLSDGPTGSFKDQALLPLGGELDFFMAKIRRMMAMLGGTSGDTGSSGESSIKGRERLWLAMLSPKNGMAPFQSAQMGALSGGNILNISVEGAFDDCQRIVKALKRTDEFGGFGAVNSINWARIASQVPYWISGYLQACEGEVGKPVDFVVPSGNFGNALAGYIARSMGVPIRRIIIATNENSVLDELIQTGNYRRRDSQITSSPSMDIGEASNYERLAFDVLERDPTRLKAYMGKFATGGEVRFEDFGLPNNYLQKFMNFDSGVSTHQDRLATILEIFKASGNKTVIDPHTADAVTVAMRKQQHGVPIVCLETALPVKFDATIKEALGFVPKRTDPRFIGLEERVDAEQTFRRAENSPEAVADILREELALAGLSSYVARG